jgi:hypothetical protein
MPSLRGKLIDDGRVTVCRGVWGMGDDAHNHVGLTSDFELKLVKSFDGSNVFPKSGKYHGWFNIKQLPPLKSNVKVEEKDITIRFVPNESNIGHRIEGEGSNKYGRFTLTGELSPDGMLQMYKIYVTKPVAKKRTVSPSTDVAKRVVTKDKKRVIITDQEKNIVEGMASTTPREGIY